MAKPCSTADAKLVLRPFFGVTSGESAYAHLDALVMGTLPGQAHRRYADYRMFDRYDADAHRKPRLDNVRFQCQVDDRHAESYGWRWGYQPERAGMFSARDLALYGASITAIERALGRLQRADGPAGTIGRFVVRLARVLRVGGIVLIETSRDGRFRDADEVRRIVGPRDYGDAVPLIDTLVAELHWTCAQRAGRAAA